MFHELRSIVWVLLLVSEGLALAGTGRAQDQLRVSIWSGKDAVNDIKKREAVRLAVQVEDAAPAPAPGTRVEAARNPAAGARVDFEAPASGPSGTFANGLRMISVTADQMGMAEVEGFRPNDVAGTFELKVTAYYQGLEGTATIKQKNVAPGSKKKLAGILAGAGGGTVAALALCCGGNGQPTPADLTIASASSASSFIRGSTGTFTLTVGNSGDTATNGTLTVTDTLPSGLTPTSATGSGWNCSVAGQTVNCTRADALNGGSSYPSITIGVNVASNAPASLTNNATVSGGGDTTPANNSSTATVNTTVPPPDLTISKTASAPTFARGGTGSFTLTVTNSGANATNGTVTVADPLPTGLTPATATGSGWTCPITGQNVNCTRADTLNSGASYPTITISVNVASNAAPQLTNTATVSGGGDTTPANNSATATVNTAAADLTISKTASAPTFPRVGTGSFTLTVTNSGASATIGTVTVSDPLPTGLTPATASGPGWTCPITGQNVNCTRADALNAGASYAPITISVNVASNAADQLTNTATVSGGGDNTPANNSATATVNTAVPDLTISKTASAPTFARGGTGSFTLTLTNNGGIATNGTVTVSDPLPTGLTPTTATGGGWTCPITGQNVNCTRADALNVGASYAPITISVNVASNAAAQLTNTATVSGGGDPTPANGSVTVNTATAPDLTISKTANASAFVRGQSGSFTLTVSNIGLATNGNTVTVTDTVPSGLTPTPSSGGTGWSCAVTGLNVNCTRAGVLAAGASYPAITVNVNVAQTAPASLQNTATVSGGGDNTPANNSATATVSIVNSLGANSLSVTKEITEPIVTPGDTVGFFLGISNPVETALTSTTLNDTLPLGFQYVEGSARIHGIGIEGTDQLITPTVTPDGLVFPIGALPAGSHVAISYETLVTSNARPGESQAGVVGVASSPSGEPVTSVSAHVRFIITASAFTLNQVLVGRVFEDSNKNGRFDNGEPGVANVRVVTSSGQAATTDSYGQYNLPSLAAGSVLVAVDPATIPPGLALPNKAGQLVRTPLNSGTMLRQNFALIRTSPASNAPELPSPRITKTQEIHAGGEVEKLEMILERPIMAAGGYDKQLIRIRAFDHSGAPATNTPIVISTVTGSVTAASTDSDRLECQSVLSLEQRPEMSRQVALETGSGEAAACLISDLVPSTTRLTASASRNAQIVTTEDVRFEPAQRPPLLVAFGEVGIGLSGPATGATEGANRIDGQVSIFYQNSLRDNDLLTVAVRSKQGVNTASGNTGFFEFDPTQRLYPVMGDASTRQELAQSMGHVYARYDRGRSYLMYGDLRGDAAAEGASGLLEYNRNVTGVRFRLERERGYEDQEEQETDWLEGQAARPKTAYIREVSTALASSAVRLSRSQIVPGSETITLEVRDRRNPDQIISRERLIRNVDYMLDPLSGVLILMRPIGLFDPSLNPIRLVSVYEYQNPGADSAVYLGRGSLSVNSLGLRLGFSALTQHEGGLNFAVGGLQLEKRLINGGRFVAEIPVSRGRLLGDLEHSSDHFDGACCESDARRNGKAIRAEFEQPLGGRDTILRGRFATTDEGFFNPYGSITVQGQQSRTISLETRGLDSSRLTFSMGKEVNRNRAVDNERQTFSAKLSQTLRENLLAEAGIDRREFLDHRSRQQIDSHLISAGLRWKPFARLETTALREQNLGEADPTYPDQTVLGAQFQVTSYTRLFATQRFSSAPILPIDGAELSGLVSPLSTRETAIGIESRLRQNTSLTTRYRMDSGPTGDDTFAVVGILSRLPVKQGLSVDWSLDNAVHLAGAGQGYVGGSIGFSQSKNDDLLVSARYELRRRNTTEFIFTTGVVGRLTESTSALARYRIASFGTGTAGRMTDGQLAVSVRPRQSDRVALLFSYDYANASTSAAGAASYRRINRLSADGLLEIRKGLELYSRVALARIPRPGGSHQATYLQARLQQSLLRRFDIAGEARWIREASNISGTLVTGVEWGTWVAQDFRIGLGYSPRGFANPGALLNSTAARGGAYLVISSQLSRLFDFMGKESKSRSTSDEENRSLVAHDAQAQN